MLTEKEVLHIAKLAKLPLSPEEIKIFSIQLAEVLTYISVLAEVKTDSVLPTFQVTGIKNVMRGDLPLETGRILAVADALRNAGRSAGQYFVVPAVLKDDLDNPNQI